MDVVHWSRTVRSTPVRWEAPASEAAVADAVRRAASEGRRVRVVGSGHSWSPTAATDDVLLTVRDLNRVISLDGDRVTIEAGATLHELLELLARNGRALPIVGSIDAQTLAGITASAPQNQWFLLRVNETWNRASASEIVARFRKALG